MVVDIEMLGEILTCQERKEDPFFFLSIFWFLYKCLSNRTIDLVGNYMVDSEEP